MILHKTTVCLSVCSPPPLATVVALNRQILIFGNSFCRSMTSFLHSLTAALTRKDEISNSQISKNRNKNWSLCFTFAFCCCCLFFGAYFCRSVSLFSFIAFALRLRLAASTDRQFAESSRDVLGINRETDKETKRPHGQLAANAASFKASKSKPRSSESRLPCPEIEIENA